jgi:uncharacterized protein DUF6941
MLQIAYALIAEAAIIQPDSRVNMLGGEIFSLSLPFFPITIPMLVVVVKIEGTTDEIGQDYHLRIEFVGPNTDDVLYATESDFRLEARPVGFEDIPSSQGYVAQYPALTFPTAGKHAFRILVNDHELRRLPLYALQIEPEQADAPPTDSTSLTDEEHSSLEGTHPEGGEII